MNDLAWISTVQCTKPFTVDDTRALYAMIKPLTGEKVEVFTTRGDKVFVRVGEHRWELDVSD